MDIDVGSIVGDYQVIGILGAGGMGKVYKVRNTISDRVEAMKVLLPNLVQEPELADRFLREIKVQASLDHPNIASLRTAVRFENQLLMIIELVEGVTLEHRVRERPLSVNQAVDYIGQVLSALSYAHRAGVIHRDIKPANMMLTSNGVVKLLDFGIAKAATDRKLTMTGTTMGSLYYMSPEQIKGAQTLDARADLYSVGVSLYELVTGKRPFDGDSQFAIMSAHLEKQPVPPMTLDPTLPVALNDVILFSVQKDPNARFQTADAFRNALVSVTAAVPAPVAPLAVAAAAPQPAKSSHRGLWVAAGAVAAVAAIVAYIELGPRKDASAGSPSAPPAQTVAAPPAVQQPAEASPPVEETKQAVTPSAPPVAAPSNKAVPKTTRPADSVAANAAPPVQIPQTQTTPTQAQQIQQSSPPVQTPQSAAPPTAAAPAPDLAAKRAELMKAREALAMLSARAGSIRSTMQNIQRSQAASGLGMRGDWLQAATMMDTFLKAATDASNASDVASAKDFMEKAERQIEKLETALNK